MTKPWIGYLASGLILLAGILELLAGKPWLGIFLLSMAVISFILRIYFLKKFGNHKDH